MTFFSLIEILCAHALSMKQSLRSLVMTYNTLLVERRNNTKFPTYPVSSFGVRLLVRKITHNERQQVRAHLNCLFKVALQVAIVT